MPKKMLFTLAVLVVAVAGGGLFLATWEIPPPTTQVEKILPDETFPR
ncbi:MAG TPA: hypothetical protein VGA50_06380 [Kiloniellales bacterium]